MHMVNCKWSLWAKKKTNYIYISMYMYKSRQWHQIDRGGRMRAHSGRVNQLKRDSKHKHADRLRRSLMKDTFNMMRHSWKHAKKVAHEHAVPTCMMRRSTRSSCEFYMILNSCTMGFELTTCKSNTKKHTYTCTHIHTHARHTNTHTHPHALTQISDFEQIL